MTTSDRMGITELASSQLNRSATVNQAIAGLETGAGAYACVAVGINTPPGSPTAGQAWVIGTSPTGAWAGKAAYVARYYQSAWLFIPPIKGYRAYDQTANSQYLYDGSAWSAIGIGGDVGGPGSSVSGNIATFNGTTGKVIQDSGAAISTDGTFSSNSNSKVPTEQAIKGYVDGKVAGLSWKQAVRAATTANGALATAYENGDTIDGVTLATGDRILLKDQTTGSENGIYTVNASGAPTRATDADVGSELVNATIYVSEGTTNADTQWTCSTNAPITVGSTSLTFAQLNSGGVSSGRQIISGSGLTGGGDLSADRTLAVGAGTGITVNADDVQIATAYQAPGRQTIWIPAGAMVADTTNGPSTGTVQPTSHGVIFPTLDFDASTQEYAQFQIRMPKGWNESTVTFMPTWSHAATVTNFGVVWKLDAVACSDNDAGDATFGTGQTSTDTGGTTNNIYIAPESSAITIGGSPVAEDLVTFRLYRVPSDASDTLAVDARLHGITLYYTIDAANDA
ncbi:MAG: DUF2793 domain-containing protein [Mesorhizobium sp.]|uniref:DUF2793 domain-containing protein n=1 Tax=Mesorhizobium sp. TaxID=1871066 RepID=UPI00122C084C|nr:DUF2793 domain-containing protein [Mesorhizobium sp.]TJV51165.1 MAG: DUF2793 domain-containing protein [Mesorhizobium sp.]